MTENSKPLTPPCRYQVNSALGISLFNSDHFCKCLLDKLGRYRTLRAQVTEAEGLGRHSVFPASIRLAAGFERA
jgi:hypothetical protein